MLEERGFFTDINTLLLQQDGGHVEEGDEAEIKDFGLRPIEDYPVLTWEDRVDMEGQPAPRIQRGRHERRVFDTHVDRALSRDNPDPVRPFGHAIAARGGSPIAHDRYAKSAVEVGISHRLFHQASRGERHRMAVPLAETVEVMVDLGKIVDRGPHTFSFIGTVEEHEDSAVHLVYNEGTVSGTVALYGNDTWDSRHFEFVAMEDGLVAVRELKAEAVVETGCGCCVGLGGHGAGGHESNPYQEEELLGEPAEPMGDVDHIVDITVGYGRQARVAAGGVSAIEGQIIAAVDRMNTTFANSGITNTKLVLLGMMEDPDYEFPGWDPDRIEAELSRLGFHSSDGHLNAVYDFSEELGTDLRAFIIRDRKNWGGFANQPGRNSVIARTAVNTTSLLFVHEVGHNFGLSHSWGDSTFAQDTNTNAHNYGWRHRSGNTRRRTVMSYDHDWQAVMHFSNPDVLNPSLGVRTGAVDGYDARNDDTTDSRYVSGGLVGSLGAGFDGSNANLGARNAHVLMANAATAAARGTRASLGVTRPTSGEVIAFGEPYLIEWVGGAYHDNLDMELLKGGALIQTLGSDLINGERVFSWTPEGLSQGNDYQLRLILNDGEEVAVSAHFTITSDYPVVVATYVAPRGVADPGLSQVAVTFNRSMDPDSFSPGTDVTRFVGPGGEDLRSTFADFTWSEDDTVLTFSFSPQNDVGFYRIDFGPDIQDLRGFAMDQNGNGIPGEIDDGFGFSYRIGELADGGTETLIDSNFSINPGFTLEGGWAVGPPNQSGVGGPGSAYSGSNVMGTYLDGNYLSGVSISAISPSFNTQNASDITLSFRRWLGLSAMTGGSQTGRYQDQGAIQYSLNGGSWTDLWRHDAETFDDGGWSSLQTIVLPSAAQDQDDVRIRFLLETENNNSYGWNLDVLTLTADYDETFAPPPAPKVVGHMPAGAVLAAPSSLWIDFDQPMNTDSFSLSDLSDISGADASFEVTAFAWTANNRLRLDLAGVTTDGSYSLTLGTGVSSAAGDALQASYTASFDLGTFDPPVIVTESLPMAHEGQAYNATLEAESPNGLSLSLSVTGLPGWLSFADQGDGTGILSGTPPVGTQGPVSLTFIADDSANTAEETFALQINHAPVAQFDAPLTDSVRIPDGVMLLFEGSVSDDGLPGGGLTQSWTVLSKPDGATVTFEDSEALETAVSFDVDGDYTLRFMVSDGVLNSVYDFAVEAGAVIGDEEGSSGWTAQDIGSGISTPGETTFAGGSYTVSVDSEDIWGSSDSFHYAWQQMSGDWVVEAEINWLVEDPFQFAKSGLMIRETLDADSKFAMAMWSGLNNDVLRPRLLRRTSTGGSVDGDWGSEDHNWVRLVRSGDDFSLYQSMDGDDWSHVQTRTVSMVAEVYVGLALSSHQNSGWTQVEFSKVEGFGGGGNIAPLVNAGASRTVDLSQTVLVSGTVEDDGLPESPGEVSIEWLLNDGPSSVIFSSAQALDTEVEFGDTGQYTLRLTAFDGEVKTAHDKLVTVESSLESPIITSWPTASDLDYGQVLSDASLSGGAAENAEGDSVDGSFAFIHPNVEPSIGTNDYSVRFTPADSSLYRTVDGSVSVTVLAPEVTVTFDANGGISPDPATITVTYGEPYGALPSTSRSDYHFDGWFTQASGGSLVSEATQVSQSEDHTLYAQWTAARILMMYLLPDFHWQMFPEPAGEPTWDEDSQRMIFPPVDSSEEHTLRPVPKIDG